MVAGLVPAGSASLDGMLHSMGRSRKGHGSHAGSPHHDALFDARACFDGYHWLTFLMGRGKEPEATAQAQLRPTGAEERRAA